MKTGNTSTVPASMMPAPIFDQLEISIWKGLYQDDIILPTFEKCFGKPFLTKDGKALRWKDHGISMSAREKWGYRIIRFPATEKTLAAINPVLKLFPRRSNGKSATQLRSAEIAWDFPVNANYDEAEKQLHELVAVAFLNNPKAKLQLKYAPCLGLIRSSDCYDECQYVHRCLLCRDMASNGLITAYFRSMEKVSIKSENKDEENYFAWQPRKKATFWGKIYCKKQAPKEPWCIRFEVTLIGPKLARAIGRSLPANLAALSRRLEGLRFDDFWSFKRFDWLAFMEAAHRSADYNGPPVPDIETKAKILSLASTKLDGINVAMWQIQLAKKIARRLSKKLLKEKLKKFIIPLKSEDVLPKVTQANSPPIDSISYRLKRLLWSGYGLVRR
jgi:hypothetical protein